MKTEVYSWRLSPHLKSALEEAARAERKSVAELLEEITRDWLGRSRSRFGPENEQQRRLHETAMEFIGALDGGRPDRTERARSDVRERIARRHGHQT